MSLCDKNLAVLEKEIAMCRCSDKKSELPKRADGCPFWEYEQTNVIGMAKGHCTTSGGSNDIDGCDPCCGAGFPEVKKHNAVNEDLGW